VEDPLHALVCNAFGYDKSIVRALALNAWQIGKHSGDQKLMDLAQRVLDAEKRAHDVSNCADVHPFPE
jgi:non-homologous end joining protein Ku